MVSSLLPKGRAFSEMNSGPWCCVSVVPRSISVSSTAEPPAAAGPLIVHVVRQFYPNRGGLEDVVMNLGRSLVDRGFRVRVVTLDRLFVAPDRRLPAHEMLNGIEVVRIGWKGSSRYPLAPGVFRHLADADLVHVHGVDFFFDALALGWPLHRRPMVATTHGGFFHTGRHALIKKIWFRTLTRLSSSVYARIVGCSRSDVALFSKVAPGRTVLIENGADIAKFRDRASRVPAKRLVTIGRFSTHKRIDRLLDALQNLVRDDAGWQLDIIGVPGEVSLAEVEAMIAARGLGAKAHVRCDLENDAIAGLLGQASLFVSASEYEGFGLVAVEAMSAGLQPVLQANDAYRLLGERHPVIALTDFSDPAGAASAILDAYAELSAGGPERRTALVNEADSYTWDRVADRYLDVYRDAMGRVPVSEGKRL